MMENLVKLSFVMFSISLVSLVIVSRLFIPQTLSFDEAFSLDKGEFVTIDANLLEIYGGDNYFLLRFSQEKKFTVFADNIPSNLKNISYPKKVRFIAEVEKYDNKKELRPIRFIN